MSSFESDSAPWQDDCGFVPDVPNGAEFVPNVPETAGYDGHETTATTPEPDIDEIEAAAFEAGRTAGIDEANRQLDPVLHALQDAAEKLARQRTTYLQAQRRQLVELAMEIATALIGRAVEADAGSLRDRIEGALALVDEDAPIDIALNPQDCETLANAGGGEGGRLETLQHVGRLRFVADAELAVGDAIVSSGATSVDLRMAALLEQLRAEFEGLDAIPEAREETEA